jgi:hypothetical protein
MVLITGEGSKLLPHALLPCRLEGLSGEAPLSDLGVAMRRSSPMDGFA